MKLNTFINDPVTKAFPNWSELPVEDREDIRFLWGNANKMFAHKKLVQVYGMDCDSETDGCNPHEGNGSERERR